MPVTGEMSPDPAGRDANFENEKLLATKSDREIYAGESQPPRWHSLSANYVEAKRGSGILVDAYNKLNRQWHNFASGRPKLRYLSFGLLTIIICVVTLSSNHPSALQSLRRPQPSAATPFTGAFAHFPTISSLDEDQKRLSALAMWNDDSFSEYMRHFIYSVQKNADSLDLLFVNRKTTPHSKCIDWAEHKIDISYAGNIKFVCMSNEEYQQRHVDFLCGKEYGWDCNKQEYADVVADFDTRINSRNLHFRPLLGWIFRDLMRDPKSRNWAWLDVDDIVGNLTRYPYNVLSKSTMVWGHGVEFECFYFAGQLTAFNYDDPGIIQNWKLVPQLQSARHFTHKLAGEIDEDENEERLWSNMLLQSEPGLPGNNVSYVVYPALHGDDFGGFRDTVFVVSGRDVLSVSKHWSREHVEKIIQLERQTPIDDLGSIGWTGGVDGSEYLVQYPEMPSDIAKAKAVEDFQQTNGQAPQQVHLGLVEDVTVSKGKDGTCLGSPNDLAKTDPPIMRTSYVRFKGQEHNHILRRYERDDRSRGWERKLIRHHLWTKKKIDFPAFEITDDMVLRYDDHRFMEVWRMGPGHRDRTIYQRGEGTDSIG